MGSLGGRLAKFDDESVIYRVDDPQQNLGWRRLAIAYAVGTVLALVLMAGADRLFGRPVGALAVLVLIVVFLVLYVVWRRQGTGS